MNPAHLKSVRELLGLSAADLAEISGVAMRTVQRWESERECPADVVETLEARLSEFNGQLDRIMEAARLGAESVIGAGGSAEGLPIDLSRFPNRDSFMRVFPNPGLWSWGMHSALINAAVLLLEREGFNPVVGFVGEES